MFVSSHLMSEMALTADQVIVIGRGRLITDISVDEFVRQASGKIVHVRSPQATELRERLDGPGVTATLVDERGLLEVTGLTAAEIGDAAAASGIPLHELTPQQASLEEAFMTLTRDDIEFKALAVRPRERGGGSVSSVATTTALPRLPHTGKVTQLRVCLSEWTKLRSVRSTRWSLAAAVVFTIGIAALACAVVSHHWPHMSAADRADFHPLEVNLAGSPACAACDRRSRRPRDHGRVLHGHDPRLDDRGSATSARSVGQGDRLRPRDARADDPGHADRIPRRRIHLQGTAHQHRLLASGSRARRDRCGALSHRRRPVRPRTGRDRPEHGRRHRDVRRDHVRAAAADERLADQLEQRGLAVPAAGCRAGDHVDHPWEITCVPGWASPFSAATQPLRSQSRRSCSSAATPSPRIPVTSACLSCLWPVGAATRARPRGRQGRGGCPRRKRSGCSSRRW